MNMKVCVGRKGDGKKSDDETGTEIIFQKRINVLQHLALILVR